MGGISLPALNAASIIGGGSLVVFAQQGGNSADQIGSASSYRPPQWSSPAMTMLTIPAQYVQSIQAPQQVAAPVYNAQGSQISAQVTAPPNAVPTYLVFDGVMHISHSQQMVATEHPVQNSANLSDHIRASQAIVSMDVLMTDVLPAYASGMWSGNASKSVACFQTLDSLRLNRIPLTVTTRLKTYYPMFIMNVTPDETVKTRYGFRGRIEFKQLNLFSVASQNVSSRSQSLDSNTIGQTNPTPVPAGVTAQNGLTASEQNFLMQSQGDIAGSGDWSSNNTGQLPLAVQ